MKVLGIETSCDETAAAVLVGDHLVSNIIASQTVHQQFGGVVPELASRAHIQLILPTVEQALSEAGLDKHELDGIAVTYGPGLAVSLLVGLNFGKAMALALHKPFVGVHHIEGHVFSNSVLVQGPVPPFMSLVISGGHTQLMLVREWGSYQILGRTRDDAAGEAFDKVARMLGLSYPGGPAIEKLAREGQPAYVRFPEGKIKENDLDFSFSGLKTAVLYHLHSLSEEERNEHRADIAASFQEAAIGALARKSLRAMQKHKVSQLALAGGVACNGALRNKLKDLSETHGFELFYPPAVLCTDNAAMIAKTGLFYLEQNVTSDFSLSPRPTLPLEQRDAGDEDSTRVHIDQSGNRP